MRILLLSILLLSSSANFAAEPVDTKAQRREAASRPRPLIYNNDGNEPLTSMREPTREALLAARTAGLEDSQVSTLFYSTNAGFGTTSRGSKVWKEWTVVAEPHVHNQLEAMLAKDLDPLEVMVEYAREHGMEIFSDIRMNDTHDATLEGYGIVRFANNPFKQAHPECLLGTAKRRPKHNRWSAVNYAKPEVRESLFRFAEEACRNYDIDGLSLDFFRTPGYFPSTAKGQRATDEERRAMTDLVRRIREMADQVGRERGSPMLLAIRVPDSVEYCRAVGLDLEHWLASGYVDLLVVGGLFHMQPWDDSVALARRHGVPVYASLDEPRLNDATGKELRGTLLAYRGRAADAWRAGVDGIYMFNFNDPQAPHWHELGDPGPLAALEKDYFACPRGTTDMRGYTLPPGEYRRTETLNPDRPKVIAAGQSATAEVSMGDISARDEMVHTLFVTIDKLAGTDGLTVKWNGEPLENLQYEDQVVSAVVEPSLLREGLNTVEVSLSDEASEKLEWRELRVTARKK